MKGFLLAIGLAVSVMAMTPVSAAPVAAPRKPAAVIALAEKVADYQLASLAAGVYPNAAKQNYDPKGWVQGTFFLGLTRLADHSAQPHYRRAILARGEANHWQLADRPYHADDYLIGQSYFWASQNGATADGPNGVMAPMRARMEAVLAKPSTVDLHFIERPVEEGPPVCLDRWCWCDALFMAPATWLEMSKATGDPRYAAFAMSEFRATTAFLYDPAEDLYFRDSRFFDRHDPNGKKLFWSRGNGWVIGGLTNMIPLLPQGSADRAELETLFRKMAARLKGLQKPDGFWAASLLADQDTAPPESSGTGFAVYALAWGVEHGLLDRKAYEPTIRKGWAALTTAVHPDGRLGYVQQISDRPDSVSYEETQFYGVGAFLLAATAVADLDR